MNPNYGFTQHTYTLRRLLMRKDSMWLALLMGCLLVAAGCGGAAPEPPAVPDAPEAPSAGEEVAKEILATFDECVAKAAELAQDKPEPADLTPRLEELYAEYKVKMAALNEKYLALRDSNPSLGRPTATWASTGANMCSTKITPSAKRFPTTTCKRVTRRWWPCCRTKSSI